MNEVKILNIGGSNQNIKDQYARNIIAPSENNLTAQDQPYASRDYNEGDYLIGQDRNLYKALTDIHTGDILAVNVNIKATTISGELVALEDSSVEEALEIIAYTENSSLSTRAYAIGDNLYWNYGANQGLYKVTTAIAIGDAFAVGSNIEAAEPIAKQLEDVDDTVDVVLNELGAKNLLQNQLANTYDFSEPIYGITFVINSDGSVTANGTCTQEFWLVYKEGLTELIDGESYILNGNPNSTDYYLYVRENNQGQITPWIDYGEGVTFTYNSSYSYHVMLSVRNGVTVPNVTFRPMIRPAAIKDDTYVPYSRTNQELAGEANAMLNILGAKNLLPITATTQTVDGITYTVNSDGRVRAQGAVTSGKSYSILYYDYYDLDAGDYILSGCPTGGGNDKWGLYIAINGSTINPDIGNGKRFTLSSKTSVRVRIGITTHENVDLTFRPMIRPASIKDDTYVPYARTNRELSVAVEGQATDAGWSLVFVDNTLRMSGGVCEINVQVTREGYGIPGGGYSVIRIPEKFRPKNGIKKVSALLTDMSVSTRYPIYVLIDTSGGVTLPSWAPTSTTMSRLIVFGTYLVD